MRHLDRLPLDDEGVEVVEVVASELGYGVDGGRG